MQSFLSFWMKYFFKSRSTCTAGRVPLDPVASLFSDVVWYVSLTDSRVQSICCTVALHKNQLNCLVTFLFALMGKPSTNTLSCQTDVTTLSCWGFGMHDILVTMRVLTSLTWFKLTTCQSIFMFCYVFKAMHERSMPSICRIEEM